MAVSMDGEQPPAQRSPRSVTGLEIYRRLILLHVELIHLAERKDSDDNLGSIEGSTALAATALMIRALASAFFRSLTPDSLAPEGGPRQGGRPQEPSEEVSQLCLRDRVRPPWDARFDDRVCDAGESARDDDND